MFDVKKKLTPDMKGEIQQEESLEESLLRSSDPHEPTSENPFLGTGGAKEELLGELMAQWLDETSSPLDQDAKEKKKQELGDKSKDDLDLDFKTGVNNDFVADSAGPEVVVDPTEKKPIGGTELGGGGGGGSAGGPAGSAADAPADAGTDFDVDSGGGDALAYGGGEIDYGVHDDGGYGSSDEASGGGGGDE